MAKIGEAESTPDDMALIARAQNGEQAAFETLFRTYKQRVFRLCLYMTRNTSEAEDLTQDAFLQVFRKIHTFRGESAFSTWLHRLTVNLVLMHRRKAKKHELLDVDGVIDNHEDTEQAEKFGVADLAQVTSLDRILLKRAIAQLPPGWRRVFVLHDILGWKHHEIAAILGCSVGNSKSQLQRGRMRLRTLLILKPANPTNGQTKSEAVLQMCASLMG